ncbi:MAG: hypothetical protein L0211_12335 [Planctomycetaceae bacterium]|nr:hypothetical protein [Planctomycetaceae bacterium]
MMTPNFITTCLIALLSFCTTSTYADGPYVGGKFQGRIAWSADGNHNDPDDWAASPVALAIFAQGGLRDRLVHFDYNCILPQTDPEWEKTHARSVLGAQERYGYDKGLFHDCRQDLDGAVASIAKAIDGSSADNPLYFIVAGPMEVPVLGIKKSQPDKRQFVYCISHSRWNDGFASKYTFTHTKRSVIETGVNWVQIRDQNRLLSKSPYGQPAPPQSWRAYHWMRDSGDARVRFLWERMQVSTRPDPSDAGMAWFLLTGDEEADPEKLRRLLDEQMTPQPVTRDRIRLEAENFRDLTGFTLVDRNDRNASHRLSAQLTQADEGSIATVYREPFAVAAGRYDVEIRYSDEQDRESEFQLLVKGTLQGSPWKAPGKGGGWMSHTVSDVQIRQGEPVAVQVKGRQARLDYVQLNSRSH